MRITAGRREDILRDKKKFDTEHARRMAISDEADQKYYQAAWDRSEEVRKIIEDGLAQFNLLQFRVEVDFRGSGTGSVRVYCDEDRKFDDAVPLAWDYRANCQWGNDDVIVRETSSWSGMKATKPEHIASLRQSVDALEFLNSLDWDGLLIHTGPDRSDYRVRFDEDPEYDQLVGRKFDQELIELDLEEAAGTNKWFKVSDSERRYNFLWARIDKVSPATYLVSELSDRQVENLKTMSPEDFEKYKEWYARPHRYKKSEFINKLYKPLESEEL